MPHITSIEITKIFDKRVIIKGFTDSSITLKQMICKKRPNALKELKIYMINNSANVLYKMALKMVKRLW